jgi:protein-S-isoprenylcysteine O-methyltransferase Ste14
MTTMGVAIGNPLFLRSVVAFVALPGIVAIAVPLAWLQATAHLSVVHPAGLLPLLGGSFALLWCVRDFHVAGKGTLAPWSPPRHLVTSGLYRFSRNPMYVAVLAMLLGWSWAFAHSGLAIYAACVALAFELRVVFGEEPWLARAHGVQWSAYAAQVPRWIGWRVGR